MRFKGIIALVCATYASLASAAVQKPLVIFRSDSTRAIRLDVVRFDTGKLSSFHPYVVDSKGRVTGHLAAYGLDELIRGVNIPVAGALPKLRLTLDKVSSARYAIRISWLSLEYRGLDLLRIQGNWRLFYTARGTSEEVREIKIAMKSTGPIARINSHELL